MTSTLSRAVITSMLTAVVRGNGRTQVISGAPGFCYTELLRWIRQAVVSMGGYNTVCEILSFDKPALVVPRTVPREEQLIRASRASELGLFDMLLPEDAENPAKMAAALKALPNRAPPSVNARGLKLDGLENISRRIAEWLPPEGDKAPITLTA